MAEKLFRLTIDCLEECEVREVVAVRRNTRRIQVRVLLIVPAEGALVEQELELSLDRAEQEDGE